MLRSIETAIVGAGVTGLSVAYHLVESGARGVEVFDRTGIAAEASGVQPGGVRQQWSTKANCRLARESFFFYREFGERLQIASPPVLECCGYLFVAESESVVGSLRANVELQRECGVPSEFLTPEEAGERVAPLAREDIFGGAYCPQDGYFDRPQSVVEGFAEAARRHGARVERGDVKSIEQDGGGWLLAFGDGEQVHADQVVVAAGYGTPAILRPAGVDLPIAKEAKYLFFSEPIRERLLEPLVVAGEARFAAKQLANGRVLASDLGAHGEPSASEQHWRGNIRAGIRKFVPLLEYVAFSLLITGYYDMTPDHQAIVGPVGDGLWVAAGFSGHGFMMAPAIGRALASSLAGAPLDDRFDAFSLDRFERGKLTPETQVV